MPYQQLYFLNGPDLLSSTAVYLDIAQNVLAPDGYYSDGVTVRELSFGVLLPPEPCQQCGFPCFDEAYQYAGGRGVFDMTIELGSAIGAVIIRFTPNETVDGIKVVYDGLQYDTLSVMNTGVSNPIFSAIGPPVFFGDASSGCDTPAVVNVPKYIWDGNTFLLTPSYEVVNVSASQVIDTGSAMPNTGVMVIPKTNATPSFLEATIYSICDPASWSIAIGCPQLLLPIYATEGASSAANACQLVPNQIYYSAPVNGDGEQLNISDWMFTDPYGSNLLADGWYAAPIHLQSTSSQSFEVTNGVISRLSPIACPTIPVNITSRDFFTGAPGCISGGVSAAIIDVYWQPLQQNVYSGAFGTPASPTLSNGVYEVVVTISFDPLSSSCQDLNVVLTLTNSLSSTIGNQVFTPMAGGAVTFTYQFQVASSTGSTTIDIDLYPI